jgi:flagellar hook-associated protein 3 FlgL
MYRISTNLPNNDMQHYMRQREFQLNQTQNKIASQNRIQQLRDDPVGAAHSTRYQSYITRLERFQENAEYAQNNYRVAEKQMQQAVDMMQRVREIAIQGANGTYTQGDLQKMGQEVNELLEEMVQLANARNGDGSTIFSGHESNTLPFRAVKGNVQGASGQVITNVQYVGDIGTRKTEISEGSYMNLNIPGNEVFWAEQQQIYSSVNASGYQVQEDSTIHIDGTEIELQAGDNISAVIHKINNSDTAVKARMDPVQQSLVLETTTPHQMWLQDGENSTVLQDLGILGGNQGPAPANVAESADKFGGSVFDMMIRLRNELYAGDTKDIGGSALQGIDHGLDNMLSNMAKLGARDTRLQFVNQRLTREIDQIGELNSNEVDVNMANAITDLRMLEHTKQAALSTSARIIQPTLLDFLR